MKFDYILIISNFIILPYIFFIILKEKIKKCRNTSFHIIEGTGNYYPPINIPEGYKVNAVKIKNDIIKITKSKLI